MFSKASHPMDVKNSDCLEKSYSKKYGICDSYDKNKYSLFHQLVINMGKYWLKKRKVRKNKECHQAQVVFADFSLLGQIFPHINYKLMK